MRHKLIIPFILLTMLVSACNLPGGAPPAEDQGAMISTSVAQTVAAQQAGQPPAATSAPVEPSATQPPAQPEDSATPEPTATLEASTTPAESTATATLAPTATSAAPMISASVNTNCRRGPSRLFDPPVGVLAVGQSAVVRGRLADNSWYLIENPTRAGSECWVWSDTTSIQGDASAIPVATPPPLPPTPTFTPTTGVGFSAAYEEVHNCSGNPTAIFEIENTGGVDYESLQLKIEDLTDSDTLYGATISNAPFLGSASECPPGGDTLEAGDALYIGGAIGPGNSGHSARATIKLCTDDDLDETCVEKKVDFTIP